MEIVLKYFNKILLDKFNKLTSWILGVCHLTSNQHKYSVKKHLIRYIRYFIHISRCTLCSNNYCRLLTSVYNPIIHFVADKTFRTFGEKAVGTGAISRGHVACGER